MYNSNCPMTNSFYMPKYSKAFIQIYLCLISGLFLYYAVSAIRFPYGADYGEAPLMDQVSRIEKREVLYKPDIDQPPYVITNYPPLYSYWVALVNSLTKIPLFQAGRITSLFFSLVSGAIIGLFSYQLTKNIWLGVLGCALFWGNPYIMIWSSLARVDLMALAFSLLGLWILFQYWDTKIGLILAGLSFLVSVYTRQTYLLAAPLAGSVWLWHNNRKVALAFISSFGISLLLIFGTVNALTQGGFYNNIVLANINRYSISQTVNMVVELFKIWPVVLITSVILLVFTLYLQFCRTNTAHIRELQQGFTHSGLVIFTLGSTISVAAAGKLGSNVNYFFEFLAASSIWCILGLGIVLRQSGRAKYIFLSLVFLQSIWVLGYSYLLVQMKTGDLWQNLNKYDQLDSLIQTATQNGVVLSDDYMDMIVLSGQPIYYQPFEYGELYQAGAWDSSLFTSQIIQRKFPLIIIGGTTLNKNCCWPPPVIAAIESNYQIETRDDFLILRPLNK